MKHAGINVQMNLGLTRIILCVYGTRFEHKKESVNPKFGKF